MKITNPLKALLILIVTFLFLNANAVEKYKQQGIPFKTIVPCHNDPSVLQGFSKMIFFLNTPCHTLSMCKKIENLAIGKLQKVGQVSVKQISTLVFSEDKEGVLKNPSLTYDLVKIHDIDGKALPIFKASLTFNASVIIENNNQYNSPALWQCCTYLQIDEIQNLEETVTQTLSPLLENFKNDFLEANQNSKIRPVFYFAK